MDSCALWSGMIWRSWRRVVRNMVDSMAIVLDAVMDTLRRTLVVWW